MFYPFVSGGLFYTDHDNSTSMLSIELSGGATLMLTRSVSLTGKAFYQIDSRNSDNLDGTIGGNAFELRAGISAFVF